MNATLVVEGLRLERRGPGGRKVLYAVDPNQAQPSDVERGQIPRVTRLMALAIRIDELLSQGAVGNYAEVARLGHVSRARLTQIMNLRLLAPEIQEAILFLPRTTDGRAPLRLADLRAIAAEPSWGAQRRLWRRLRRQVAKS